jgi:hypothetical protein
VSAQAVDPNINVVSYYTDAGDEFMFGAKAEVLVDAVLSTGVPIGLVQLDDWAQQSTVNVNGRCVYRWAGDPTWFPDGWKRFSKDVGAPLALYLPGAGICPGAGAAVFNITTLNGSSGRTLFEVPTPADAPRFFTEIFRGGLEQGMGHTLEIDFLDFAFLQVPEFRENVTAYPTYFTALGEAAAAAASAVELCMTLPHHALAAVALPHITTMRVGPDYDWPTNCDAGVLSFLPWAIGLRPSKDSFMTSNRSRPTTLGPPFVQQGVSNMMALPELNAIIAVFSTGPVGIADGVNATNATLVMSTCDSAGRLLQPDKPFTPIDATFARAGQDSRGAPNGRCKSAWMSKADNGAIWSSFTQLGGDDPATTPAVTHYILAINVSRPWVLRRADLWPPARASSVIVTRRWNDLGCSNGSLAVASGCVEASAPGADLADLHSRCESEDGVCDVGESPFVLAAMHEVLSNGWVFWEDSKYVSVSRRRFEGVTPRSDSLRVTVHGAEDEVVRVVALQPTHTGDWIVRIRAVQIGRNGSAVVNVP